MQNRVEQGTKSNAGETSEKSGRHYVIFGISAVIGFAAFVYFGSVIRRTEPDYYQPARTALITARRHLEESYSHEADLLEQVHAVHREIDAAIVALNQARLDPAAQREIESIRARLGTLEGIKRLAETSPEQLHQSYQEIVARLNALIV